MGSGRAHAIQEILDYLIDQSTVPIRVEPDPERMRPSDIPRVVCDYGKLHACTGWEPRIAFEQSLTDALQDWRTRIRQSRANMTVKLCTLCPSRPRATEHTTDPRNGGMLCLQH